MKSQTIFDLVSGLDGFRSEEALATDSSGSGTKKLIAITLHYVGHKASTVYEVRVGREAVKLTSSLEVAIRFYVENA